MLKQISIKNLGLVENENINFFDGFTVITGETGSGKSFFCNAIKLGMGERAKNIFLSSENTERTVIELELKNKIFRRVLEENKSRFFIDDIPETLKVGQAFTSQFFHMHSQHDNIFLKQPEAATEIFDRCLSEEAQKVKAEYTKLYQFFLDTQLELDRKTQELEKQILQKDFWEFQQEKMQKIQFTQEELQSAEKIIQNSAFSLDTKESIEESIEILAGEGNSVLSLLDTVEVHIRKLEKAENIRNRKSKEEIEETEETGEIENREEEKKNIGQKLQHIFTEVQDIITALESDLPSGVNEEEISEAQALISQISRWCKEFGVISPEQLFEKKETLEKNLEAIKILESDKNKLREKKENILQKLSELADVLSQARAEKREEFGILIQKKCRTMGMEKAIFTVHLKPVEICKYGKEQVEFLFSANQNAVQNLSFSASGGEIARITLALKQFFPEGTTMIFDEIDTGVSGAIAEKMALEMKNLSDTRQIISITHLPQIAAMASHHLVVEKTHLAEKTVTRLRYVTGDERVEVLAKMISGECLTEEALHQAKKLLHFKEK